MFGLIFLSVQTHNMLVVNNRIFKEISKWEILIESLIQVESRGNNYISSGNSLGCLQITPIYVREVNNILGYNKYSLDDRKSKSKSIEMFNIIQIQNNPTKNISKAIRLHNPNAKQYYFNKVYKQMKLLSNL